MLPDTRRRDTVLDYAIAAGKFSEQRRPFWATAYDRDPAGTEAVINLFAVPPHMTEPYPRELFPELARRVPSADRETALAGQPVVASIGSTSTLTAELVAGWSRQLFPETHAACEGRITKAGD